MRPTLSFPPTLTLTNRLKRIVKAHGDLLIDHLIDDSGRAWNDWDVATGMPIDDSDVVSGSP